MLGTFVLRRRRRRGQLALGTAALAGLHPARAVMHFVGRERAQQRSASGSDQQRKTDDDRDREVHEHLDDAAALHWLQPHPPPGDMPGNPVAVRDSSIFAR